jgi:hypothetical protein
MTDEAKLSTKVFDPDFSGCPIWRMPLATGGIFASREFSYDLCSLGGRSTIEPGDDLGAASLRFSRVRFLTLLLELPIPDPVIESGAGFVAQALLPVLLFFPFPFLIQPRHDANSSEGVPHPSDWEGSV